MNTEKLYNSDLDEWFYKITIIKSICNLLKCTEEEAENHIEYGIKHGLYYTVEGYNKHFAPYEN